MAWLFLLLLLPLILIFLLQKPKQIKKTRCPPGPPGLPLIGNLHEFDSAKPHEYLWKLSKKYGPLMSLRLGSVPVLVISSSKMAKEALKTRDLVFSGRAVLFGQKKLSYNGLDVVFSPYGEYWREMRKICVLHLFSLKRVQSFRPVLEDEISNMIHKISNMSSSSQLINLSSLVMSLTSTVICRIAFGKKYDEDGHERKRFDQILKEFQAMVGGFFVTDYIPSLSWIDKLTGIVARLEKNFQDLDSFYQELIEEHLNPDRPQTMNGDVLDILIQIKEERSAGIDLTWDHIKGLLMNIFIAGTDTSGATIIWAMTALMKTPSALKRVQAEIRDLVRKKGAIMEEDEELPYLDAVIKETMRLYPPAPVLVPRETIESCNIEGFEIGPKTCVFINNWAISRDPEIWENPVHFIPERFLNNEIDVKGKHFEVIPFGAGRRGCPGIFLGLSTVKLVLSHILYSFDWKLPSEMKIEDIDIDVLPGLTMHKKNALCILANKYA